MKVVIHGHQTDVTPLLRMRAEQGAQKLADHLRRVEYADIRFEEDGVKKTVEIVLLAPNTRLVAKGESKFHEPALNDAIAKLDAQIRRLKSARKKKMHQVELRA
jgi:ribosomal subunit interface protein